MYVLLKKILCISVEFIKGSHRYSIMLILNYKGIMMKLDIKPMTIMGVMLLSSCMYAEDGVSLFEAKCATCHSTTRPSDMSKLVAPPVMGVMRHVKMKYANKKDAVNFITEYVLNPQRDKAVCMAQKIKRFGLMPSQKGNVSKAELETIASWMYDIFPTKGFKGKMHKEGQSCNTKMMSKGMKCQAGKCQSAK